MSSISLLTSAASTAAATASDLTNIAFSTTVAGKTYNAYVTYSNGEYVASDPGVAGAEASGSSVEAAENSLSMRIDALA